MTHFSILVIGDNPEAQLAPFQENNMGDCPKEFLNFSDQTDEVLRGWQEDCAGYSNIDDYAQSYCGYEKDPETGKYGYWENECAKWDWYKLGGRWTGFFRLKKEAVLPEVGSPGLLTPPAPPGTADRCLAGDVDWEAMIFIRRLEAQKDWDDYQDWLAAGSPRGKHPCFDFGIERCENGELESYKTFMDRRTTISTFAILKDGVWCERGKNGLFESIGDEDPDPDVWYNKSFLAIVNSLDGNELLSLYDCHI